MSEGKNEWQEGKREEEKKKNDGKERRRGALRS